ncbi:MAG: heavy metal translocating P-type ATPase [Lachnospiraceae bacterium]|nr:heavy metal translocating P-type ATPase [Lachnospiraceae bacterium]
MARKVYILENLGCANCAAKIEKKVAGLPGIEDATITYATKQLRLSAEDPDSYIPQIQKIANSLEPDIIIKERTRSSAAGRRRIELEDAFAEDAHAHHHHEHGEECGCGHDHGHEHSDHEHEHHHHEHGDECGCGHDHGHEHSDHEHEHHHHDHGDECGCGHDHSEHEHEHHHHDHDEECGCGHNHGHEHSHDHEHEHHHHDHGDACGCGHDHGHEHSHEHHHHDHGDDCGCGHDHGHDLPHPPGCDCELCNPHVEYCDVCGESLANCTCKMPDDGNKKRVYILENLGCANCAAKMEAKIKALPEVDYATITYSTKQLRVSAKDPDALLPTMQNICASIESEVVVVPRAKKVKMAPPTEAVSTEAAAQSQPGFFQKYFTKEKLEVIGIILGALLFVAGEIIHETSPEGAGTSPVLLGVYIVAYVVLGGKIVLTALKNLPKGQIFDENFLMTIATLGAFAIQEYPEAVGVMLFFRIGEFFEHKAVERSRQSIMTAVDMRPEVVNLLVGDKIKVIAAEDALVGDILLVRPGDRIPLDGVIIEGETRLDTSPVTGEPVPVAAGYGDTVTSGCVNTSGLIKIRVEKLLEESMVTRILDSVENAAATKPQLERFITKFSRIYTPIVVAAALITAIVPSLITGNWSYWIYTALTFLVISCPCALVLSVPLAFFSGIGAGSKKGILFKGGTSLEAIKNIKTVIMDKTGTITKGTFEVEKAVPSNGLTEKELVALCAACEITSTHPIGNSIVTYAKEHSIDFVRPTSIEEIAGKGIKAVLNGSTLLCGNRKLMEDNNIDLSNFNNDSFGTEVLAAKDGKFAGYLVIADQIKPESQDAIAKVRSLGVKTVMLTGDGEASANAIAKTAGIDEVFSRLLPEDKLTRLKEIRNRDGAVMFVGDGINDAPVLAGADVGAAMGTGADAAIEAADVVFMNASLTSVPDSIAISKASTKVAVQNVVFALIIKAMVIVLGYMGIANMWFAVFADSGVAVICVLNSVRVLYQFREKNKK